MALYGMYFTATASTWVTVEVPDVEQDTLEDQLDQNDAILEALYGNLPGGICARCAMGDMSGSPGIDLPGDWDPDYDSLEKISE